MNLDPDAAALLAQMREAMPVRMSEIPLGDLRAALAAQPIPPAPPVHSIDNLVIPGPHGGIPVRVYTPVAQNRLPILTWFHGGGFAIGTLDMYDPLCRELANASNAIVVSVDYRLAPEHRFPIGLEDCYAAVEWAAEHAASLGANPDRLGIGGDSAGGCLAMAVAQMARDRGTPRIALQVIAYGTALTRVSNLEFADLPVLGARDCEWFWQMYVTADGDRLDPRCCPLLAPDLSGLPPAFVMTAENDPTRDDTEAYAHHLATAGVQTTLKRYPGVFHGFLSMTAALERAREAMDDLGDVVRGRLGQHADTAEIRS